MKHYNKTISENVRKRYGQFKEEMRPVLNILYHDIWSLSIWQYTYRIEAHVSYAIIKKTSIEHAR